MDTSSSEGGGGGGGAPPRGSKSESPFSPFPFGSPLTCSSRSVLSPSSSTMRSTPSEFSASSVRATPRLRGQQLYGRPVMFGGGNASSSRSRRDRLMSTTPYQSAMRSKQRKTTAVDESAVKSSSETSTFSADAMSTSAKIIFDTLDRMSTPLRDARKIPVSPASASRAEKRRLLAEELDSSLIDTSQKRRRRPNLTTGLSGAALNGPPLRTIFSPVPSTITTSSSKMVSPPQPSVKRTISQSLNAGVEAFKQQESAANAYMPVLEAGHHGKIRSSVSDKHKSYKPVVVESKDNVKSISIFKTVEESPGALNENPAVFSKFKEKSTTVKDNSIFSATKASSTESVENSVTSKKNSSFSTLTERPSVSTVLKESPLFPAVLNEGPAFSTIFKESSIVPATLKESPVISSPVSVNSTVPTATLSTKFTFAAKPSTSASLNTILSNACDQSSDDGGMTFRFSAPIKVTYSFDASLNADMTFNFSLPRLESALSFSRRVLLTNGHSDSSSSIATNSFNITNKNITPPSIVAVPSSTGLLKNQSVMSVLGGSTDGSNTWNKELKMNGKPWD